MGDRILHSEVHPIVFLKEEGVYGFVVEWAGDMALVQYSFDHIQYTEYLEADEYEVIAGITFNEIEETE